MSRVSVKEITSWDWKQPLIIRNKNLPKILFCILRWRRCPIWTEVDAIKLGDNYSYNKKLQPFAQQLRKGLTKSEACLCKYALKAKQLKGYQFRRQRPILQYIADFFCKELMLIVELDGITHDNEVSRVKIISVKSDLLRLDLK